MLSSSLMAAVKVCGESRHRQNSQNPKNMRNSNNLHPASSVTRPTLASLFQLIMPVAVLGQSSGGAIRSTITNPSGAVMQGAAVTILEGGTGETRRLQTNSAGLYDAPNLPIGTYRLTAMARGFSTAARTSIEVRVGSERVIDLVLTIGPAEQTVTATSEPASVDLATSETGAVETGQVARELPLNGRDWTTLAALQPGVSVVRTENPVVLDVPRGNRGALS